MDTTRANVSRSRLNYPALRQHELSLYEQEQIPQPIIANSLQAPKHQQQQQRRQGNNLSNDLNYFLQPDETFISDNYDEMVSNFNVFISFWFFNKVPTDLGQILKEQK